MLAAETKGVEIVSPPATTPALSWKQIAEPVAPFLSQVTKRLAEQVESFDPEIAPYARYALTNQGKQLRPVLMALSARAMDNLNDDLVTAAVIVEMVHLATLVHDDIMDEAEIRRRRPTLAANWGNQISVLLGDCLFAHSLKLAASFPSAEVCRAVAGATKTVCSGEILQTHRERQFGISRAEYFKVLEMKTGELFALSCELGAWLSGAAPAERLALRKYGLTLGTAYQIYDDCVDLFGSESSVGKSLGTDLACGKLTLPVLVAWERSGSADRHRLRELIERWDARHFGQVLALLEKYDALRESQRTVHGYLNATRSSLEPLSESASRAALAGLAGCLAQQTDSLGV